MDNIIDKVIIKKVINKNTYIIYPKTTADNIVYSEEKSVKDIIIDIENDMKEIKSTIPR